ncbi:signal peptide peptidase SppA [Streptobacillus felis]|uniref:Signal peptide peptidase SppA n=1 Tax=Streptobacillus felis TaxID=1384509 RepID=A0A7Z0PE09_9FUSO|nr:signal peptide peptidase SppA [Streptobacillus felis]NYV27284.1 signal peptide peptidase SppA [Streptobacillus felis]
MFIFKFLKNLFVYTLKKIYSFFVYIFLLFIVFTAIIGGLLVKEEIHTNNTNILISDVYFPGEDKFSNSIKYIEGKEISFSDIYSSLDLIASDDEVQNIFINLDTTAFSPAQLEELDTVLDKIKKSNKKIYAYGTVINNRNYGIATYANEIIMPDTQNSDIILTGYSNSNKYYKDLFDKYGFKFEVIHVGTHKSFGQNYVRNSISEEENETLTRILDKRLNNFIEKNSNARKINSETFKDKLLNGEYAYISPEKARDLSLIDHLMFYDKLSEKIELNEENTTPIQVYAEKKVKEINTSSNKIAVIYLDGDISEYNNNPSIPFISYDNFNYKMEKAEKLDGLKGIVIRINSPGGSAIEAKQIYERIMNSKVPVYISIGDIAASGGYYISSAGDKRFINPSSLTGSIGVVSMIPKYYGTLQKFGINIDGVNKGKYIGLLDPEKELNDEERNVYQRKLQDVYEEFKNDILSNNKKLTPDSLESIAQGKVWLGSEALNLKLVDEFGGLNHTINSLQKDLKLNEDYNIVNIYSEQNYEDVFSLFNRFFIKFKLKNKKIEAINQIEEKLQFILNQKGKAMYYSDILPLEY